MSPNVNLKTWDEALSSLELILRSVTADSQNPRSRAPLSPLQRLSEPSYPSSVSIVSDQNTPRTWLDELAKAIEVKTGSCPTLDSLEHVQAKRDQLYIVALDTKSPFVENMDRTAFEKIRSFSRTA
jgi:hypothetical protein